jgi:Fe-S cluster assembly scaffold protein SufB
MSKVIKNSKSDKETKPAAIPTASTDVDLNSYVQETDEMPYQKDPTKLSAEAKKRMGEVGVMVGDTKSRAGTFIQVNHSVIHSTAEQDGVEVLGTNMALEAYPWLKDYWWKLVNPEADKFTQYANTHPFNGYFVHISPGVKATYPVQSCLYIAKHGLAQNVHNIVIVEEGAELNVITGCTVAPVEDEGSHIGVSEFYVKKGGKLSFTMIHNWAPKMAIRPRTGVILEEDAVYMSNYICLKPVRTMQMYPTAWCKGKNSRARFNSVLVAHPGSHLDVGSRVLLQAEQTRAELIARTITTGGTIISRGFLSGQVSDCKGHLECRGLILSEKGTILAIPELEGMVAGVDLSHEAAVGKIAEEEIEYFMARGLSRDQAVSTIVRGFLSVDIEGLPPDLAAQIQRATDLSQQDAM